MAGDQAATRTTNAARVPARQRDAVLEVVEGLSEEDWHRSIVPTGWTPAGMVEHLGGAEWHWFQGVVAGKQPELSGDVDEDRPPYDPMTVVFSTDEPSAEVVAFYRDQCAQSEAVLATTPLRRRRVARTGLATTSPRTSVGSSCT